MRSLEMFCIGKQEQIEGDADNIVTIEEILQKNTYFWQHNFMKEEARTELAEVGV